MPVGTRDLLGDAPCSAFLVKPLRSLARTKRDPKDGKTIPVVGLLRYTKFQKRVRPQLLAETEFLDHSLIAIGIVGFEIVKQATPLADQHEKTAA